MQRAHATDVSVGAMREILTLTTTPTGSAPDGDDAPRAPGDAPPATADGALVARACAGEALALELLVVKYQRRAVAALPERQRDAILMREIEGLDYRSIAATMGLPVNTVKSLIFRGRDAIAAAIRPMMQPTRSRRW